MAQWFFLASQPKGPWLEPPLCQSSPWQVIGSSYCPTGAWHLAAAAWVGRRMERPRGEHPRSQNNLGGGGEGREESQAKEEGSEQKEECQGEQEEGKDTIQQEETEEQEEGENEGAGKAEEAKTKGKEEEGKGRGEEEAAGGKEEGLEAEMEAEV